MLLMLLFAFSALSVLYLSVFRREHETMSMPLTAPFHVHNIETSSLALAANSSCDLPRLQVLVLTANRPESLKRLLDSLVVAEYGCARVHLQVNVDLPQLASEANLRCVEVAATFPWIHGRKTIHRRVSRAGLSQSWFEAPYMVGGREYIAIFEDDVQVSKHYFRFLNLVRHQGALDSYEIAALCLHPNDWEVETHLSCSAQFSPFLYLTPEPCNWGPIWKYDEWRQYIDWVFSAKAAGQLPYVENAYAYNYNKYLKDGKDVQSPWVWRYNYDFGKRHLRYSFRKCKGYSASEMYFAINHKEPGEHFKRKLDLENDPALLDFDFSDVTDKFSSAENPFIPAPFPKYDTWAKSLKG